MQRASHRKYHIVYRTTCMTTGRFYIGLHSTDDLADGYIGSGQRLWKSIKKHGKENHKCEILEHLPTRQTASDREKELIIQVWKIDPLCLNSGPGGLGATDRSATREETRARMKASHKARYAADPTLSERQRTTLITRYEQPEAREKTSIASKRHWLRDGARKQVSLGLKKYLLKPGITSVCLPKQCTIDNGKTVYASSIAMKQDIGQGKNGTRSLDFCWIIEGKMVPRNEYIGPKKGKHRNK